MTILAVGKFRERAQNAMRRPVGQISLERNLRADRSPRLVFPQLHEPQVLATNKIKGQKAYRAIRQLLKKGLRATAQHVAAADDRMNAEFLHRLTLPRHQEKILRLSAPDWGDDCIFEAEWLAVK